MPDIREHPYLPSGWTADHRRQLLVNEEDGYNIRAEYKVCDCCCGRGSVVNPSIDSHGIGSEEWNEWEDSEREAYISGGYDIPCPHCEGRNVVLTPMEDDPNKDKFYESLKSEASYRSEVEAERRMGC